MGGPALRLLGGVRWRAPRGHATATGAKARAVLAALGLRVGQAVMVDQLIDDVWGEEPPATARNTVQVYVSAARRGLQSAGSPLRVESLSGGYSLDGDAEHVDWFLFEALVTQARVAARGGDHARARRLLSDALGLWEGPPLADVGDAPLRAVFAPGMTAARLVALADRFDADLALGDVDVVAELVPVAEANPLDERLAGQLLLALHRAGRRGDALRHYEGLRTRFAAEIGTEPGVRLRDLHRAILDEDPRLEPAPAPVAVLAGAGVAAGATRAAGAGGGPVAARAGDDFVGRRAELAEAARLLRERRLVTLVGPPGVGKSRLAAEVAATLRQDGVATWTVGVDGVTDPELLADAVVAAVGVGGSAGRDPVERLRSHLLGRRGLVLLDNGEHLAGACGELAEALVRDRPQVAVLVTSRQPLHSPGEAVLRLDPLPVPPSGAVTAADLAGVESVALFGARVRAMQPGFELTDATAPTVAEICRTLDGLPLAIELAGARMRILTTGDLAARLDDQLGVLTARRPAPGDRHGSLRSALEASVSPLGEQERRCFARLSVFSGGFTLDAAEGLADPADAAGVLDVMHDLVDQSLVVADVSEAATRFHLLEAVRQYGASLLDDADAATARERHAAFYLDLARTAAAERRGPRRAFWRARLAAERFNLHAAMDRALADGRVETALELAALQWWTWTNAPREGVGWYRRVLAAAVRPGSEPLPSLLPALLSAAVIASYSSHEEAMGHARQAYLVALGAGDSPSLARALQHVSDIAYEAGDIAQAREAGEEALGLALELGDPYGIGRCRLTIAYNHLAADDLAEARRWAGLAGESFRAAGDVEGDADAQLLVAEALIGSGGGGGDAEPVLASALEVFRGAGSEQQVARAASLRALVLGRAGRRADAADLVREAFDIHAVIGHPWSVAHDLDVVAVLRCDLGDHVGAAGLLAAAGAVRSGAGLVPLHRDLVVRSDVETRCRAALGAAGYRTASRKGAGVDLDAAVALARATG